MFVSASKSAVVALALGLVGIVASPASAQDGMRLARECVQEIGQVADNHADRNRVIARKTAGAIIDADGEGAPDRVLRQIASGGVERVRLNSEHGVGVIRALASRCVARLQELDAHPALIGAVRNAAHQAVDRVHHSADRARQRIRRALADALGG